MNPGDLIEPAVQATLKHQGRGPEYAARVVPMLQDAVRFSRLFDYLISHLSSRPPAELDPDVRAALHLFLSWYLCDDPTSVYAHGNAAVDLLSSRHKGRGFVNALCRRLGEFIKVETGEPDDYRALCERNQPPPLWPNKARLGNGRHVVSERPIFPDPGKELAKHLSIVGALPPWFVEQLIEQHGPDAATQAAISCIERPATWLRVNPLRGDAIEIAKWWTLKGTTVERVEMPDGGTALALPGRVPDLLEHPGFVNGAFYVQDYSAQLVAPALRPEPGDNVLDLCSAPGGKAGHLAELTDDGAKILACDLTEPKMELIHENIRRMGYSSIATVQADAGDIAFPEKFERVLIDAPCSNSGVLARRVEARHRLDEKTVAELAALQLRILENAARNLARGGVIVYSVCSVLMQEGPDVVYRFLRNKIEDTRREGSEGTRPNEALRREDLGWNVEHEKYTIPVPARHDGGYVCRLKAPM